MTASPSTPRPLVAVGTVGLGLLPGFYGLLRKDLTEWRRGRRAWIVLMVSSLFMTLTAANAWLQANLAPAVGTVVPAPVLDPLTNLAAAVSSQIFVVVAIFAAMSLIVSEREGGTLAWTASKPVSRSAIWLAKWLSATGFLWLLAGLVPLAATVALAIALYGPLPVMPVLSMAMGMGMAIALFTAIGLAVATVVTSQAAVAAVGLGALFLSPLVDALLPVAEYLPTSIVGWTLAAAGGQSPGVTTPLSWGLSLVALVAFSLTRMERLEL
jgi:ABC-type transport system involved in multi-copper enzyme maturation permease subunit